MQKMSFGLRCVEVILFILLISGTLSTLSVILPILFSVITGNMPSLLSIGGLLVAAPLLLVPASVLWFWFRVPSPASRIRIIVSLSGLAIWLALIGFGSVFGQALLDQPLQQSDFVVSVVLNPAFIGSALCQISLFYLAFSLGAKAFYEIQPQA